MAHDAFERSLRGALPLAEASAFFVNLKGSSLEDRRLAKIALDTLGRSAASPATYFQNEPDAAAAEEQNAAAFYRDKARQISEQLAAEQEQGADRDAELERLQTQLAQADALGQQYQHMVSDATERAVRAQDEVLQEQQTSAALRMAYQQLRGQILGIASQEPPTTQALSDMAGMTAAPAGGPDSAGGGAPAATAMNSNPSAPGQAVATTGPAGQAPSPPAAPNSPNPEGDADLHERSSPDANGEPKRTTQVSIKQGALSGALERLGPALVGAGLGGAFAAHRPDTGGLRSKIDRIEGQSTEPSLGQSLDLAQTKMRLALGEFQESHPRAAVMIGAGVGGAMGASNGPRIVKEIRRTADALRRAKEI
ncbi:hypothetical protein LVJ94_34915 [Pendulispora rubella]|uniref:Uncharacterized protein n=1 Tax=Pendulispora rubella TaxID=2741070 RepID=A0ABZ2KTU2_9BACT